MTGKQDPSATCAPDLSILHTALHGDRTYNIGAIIARRLSKNAGSGDVYGGIYVSHITALFEIPTRPNEDYELPTSLLDFETMQRHGFIDYRAEPNDYRYNLVFDMYHPVIISLPTPTLFDQHGKQRYYVTYEEAEAHRAAQKAARLVEINAQRARRNFHQDYYPHHQ